MGCPPTWSAASNRTPLFAPFMSKPPKAALRRSEPYSLSASKGIKWCAIFPDPLDFSAPRNIARWSSFDIGRQNGTGALTNARESRLSRPWLQHAVSLATSRLAHEVIVGREGVRFAVGAAAAAQVKGVGDLSDSASGTIRGGRARIDHKRLLARASVDRRAGGGNGRGARRNMLRLPQQAVGGDEASVKGCRFAGATGDAGADVDAGDADRWPAGIPTPGRRGARHGVCGWTTRWVR